MRWRLGYLLGIGVCSLGLRAETALEVRFDAGNPPFAFEREGRAEGYYPKVVQAAAQRAGLDLRGVAARHP